MRGKHARRLGERNRGSASSRAREPRTQPRIDRDVDDEVGECQIERLLDEGETHVTLKESTDGDRIRNRPPRVKSAGQECHGQNDRSGKRASAHVGLLRSSRDKVAISSEQEKRGRAKARVTAPLPAAVQERDLTTPK